MKFFQAGLSCLALLTSLASFDVSAQGRSYLNPNSPADGDVSPFSSGVKIGDTLYLSGMIGQVGGKVPDTAEAEARLLLDRIQSTLEQADMTMDNLVYVQIFCSDLAHYEVFNEVYRSYFSQAFPARAFIGAGSLLFDARFEIQAIASQQ